jgi:hypothetical protein
VGCDNLVTGDLLEQLYFSRPFKVRNADEYDLENVLDLFIDPTEGLNNPFDYENTIIKGSMGSGKTMYLRANHAYYLYTLVTSIMEGAPLILPVYIRLSDFQHIQEPMEIYRALIIKIIEELSVVYIHLQDAQRLAQIHNGITTLPPNIFNVDRKIRELFLEVKKLSSTEYVEKIQKDFSYSGAAKPKFFELSAQFKKTEALEIKEKSAPGISDIENAYNKLLKESDGKILLLIDEAGSVNKAFFKEDGSESSMFEIFMNQLRTANYIRTKIAIYPHTYSDILTETRYGDMVNLHEDIINENGFDLFKRRSLSLIERYISSSLGSQVESNFILETSYDEDQSDVLEQIINASAGNMRRFVQLLDLTMLEAFKINKGKGKLESVHALNALKNHAISMERLYTDIDRDFLNSISNFCKTRSAYRFQFPYKAPLLSKFINKSSEYNILNIIEMGTGSKGTTYVFDYAYCVYKDIPTHFVKDTERFDRTRTRSRGDWIKRVTRISEELIRHASLPGKIVGTISYINNGRGFVKSDDGKEYYWSSNSIITDDIHKPLMLGNKLRFYPIKISDSDMAESIEVL